MHPVVRVVGIVALLGLVLGLGFQYGANEPDHSPYPDEDALAAYYGEHVGEETLVFGAVRASDPDAGTMTIELDTDYGPLVVFVTDADETAAPGGVVQVYGTLGPERAIAASNVVVVNPDGAAATYKYGVSVVGALLVLVAFFRYWRFDRAALAFEVRADG